jgi:hypothetical protein
LDIRKSNSTGWRVVVNHWRPERLNSIVSGKPAATTRMRFLPFASNTPSTMIPTGNLISRYIFFGHLTLRSTRACRLTGPVTTLAFVMDRKFWCCRIQLLGTDARGCAIHARPATCGKSACGRQLAPGPLLLQGGDSRRAGPPGARLSVALGRLRPRSRERRECRAAGHMRQAGVPPAPPARGAEARRLGAPARSCRDSGRSCDAEHACPSRWRGWRPGHVRQTGVLQSTGA